MSGFSQALHAFYGGDPKRVVQLLGNRPPAEATLEQMLLLAVAYDADGVDDPKLARAWCERIIAQYPGSPWAAFARRAKPD